MAIWRRRWCPKGPEVEAGGTVSGGGSGSGSGAVSGAPIESPLHFDYGRGMKRIGWFAGVLVVIGVLGGPLACSAPAQTSAASVPAAPPRLAASALPSLARWQQHLTEELMPFWTTDDALGTPVGNFPTFRCNDGTAFRAETPCPELAQPPGWIAPERGREYTRMKSRQTFLYGVAYHVTGDERYLEYARAGVTWLREHAYERDTGSAISYWSRDPVTGAMQAGPPREQRTTQDLAYAQVGLAFYYYLTRDPEVLADLVRLERYVMTAYWLPSAAPPGGMLRWVLADGETAGEAKRQELVSQLDQINAYMLVLMPLLEDAATAAAWRHDLLLLAHVVKEQYFAPELGMFWGRLDDPNEQQFGGRHLDFGHSMKSLWMLYLTGEATGERELVDFARPLVAPLLAKAAQASGCWASGFRRDGALDQGSQWWIFAELDQAAATLAGREPSALPYAGYLAKSYECWFTRLVDRRGHDVWPGVGPDWTPTTYAQGGPLKIFHWKNGYHAAEHALVSLITTAGLTGQRLPLYYAFVKEPPRARIQPYYFSASITDERDHPLPRHPGLHGKRVEFAGIR
jgi:mannose/cellobiose epimerase-like protein (N-acyl-D-glucosamine 2-epimerase family)